MPYNKQFTNLDRSVMPGKYQTEALTHRPSDSEVDKPNFDISRHDRMVEVSKLFIIWLL